MAEYPQVFRVGEAPYQEIYVLQRNQLLLQFLDGTSDERIDAFLRSRGFTTRRAETPHPAHCRYLARCADALGRAREQRRRAARLRQRSRPAAPRGRDGGPRLLSRGTGGGERRLSACKSP